MRIRPGRRADLPFVLALRSAVFRRYLVPWDEAQSEAELIGHHERGSVHVIEFAGTTAGYMCLLELPEWLDLDELAVTPERQRAGIGTAVVRALQQVAAARRLPVRLRVLQANPDALRLYLRLGFVLMKDEGPRLLLESRPGFPAAPL